MKTNFSFKNITIQDKKFIKDYCLAKVSKLREIVDKLNPDGVLEIRVERFVKKSAYKVSIILQKPLDIFVSEDDHTLPEAIDLAKDKMITRLRKVQAKRKYNIGGH